MNNIRVFLRGITLLVRGRLHFPKDRVDEIVSMEDGKDFIVFRHMVSDPGPQQPTTPQALFRVRFRFSRLPPRLNKLFSMLPIPLIAGLPGFRSKMWLMDPDTGEFQGIYEWDTVEHAETYPHSLALRLMMKRAASDSIKYEIIPQ